MTEQLMLGQMPRRLLTVTPSRLANFDCPRRYRMTYLDRPTPPRGAPWGHNSVGAAAHVALHRWWGLPEDRRTPVAAAALATRHFSPDGFRNDEQAMQWRQQVADWVADYASTLDPADEPRGAERTVALRTEHLALSGRVDRIDERDDELVIVDYKTGRHVPEAGDARSSQALAIYAMAAERVFRRRCRRVELHHLPSGRVAAHDHTDESLARHLDRAESTGADIVAATDTFAAGAHADEVFPARPQPSCSWCDFRKVCPEGQQASVTREPWSGLPDLDPPH